MAGSLASMLFSQQLGAEASAWHPGRLQGSGPYPVQAPRNAVSALLRLPTSVTLRVDHTLLAALGVVCFSGIAALNYYSRWQRVLALESEGNRLRAARQLEAAKLQFERAKQIEPADCRPHLRLSSIHFGLG
jgi:hypothetical protein